MIVILESDFFASYEFLKLKYKFMKRGFLLILLSIFLGNIHSQNENKQINKTYTNKETELIFYDDSTFDYRGGDISAPHYGKYKLIENVGYIISSTKNESSLRTGLTDSIFECNCEKCFSFKILFPNLDELDKKRLCFNYNILFERKTDLPAKQIIEILEKENSEIEWRTSQYVDDTIFFIKTLSYNPEIQIAQSNLLKVKEIRYLINYDFTKLIFNFVTIIKSEEKCIHIEIPNLTSKYIKNIRNDFYTNEFIEIVDSNSIKFRDIIYYEKDYFKKNILKE